MVIDTDGSAFITKAEFDSLKNNFQAQIDNYNSSIDNKIDGAIAAYLAGIKLSSIYAESNIYSQRGGDVVRWQSIDYPNTWNTSGYTNWKRPLFYACWSDVAIGSYGYSRETTGGGAGSRGDHRSAGDADRYYGTYWRYTEDQGKKTLTGIQELHVDAINVWTHYKGAPKWSACGKMFKLSADGTEVLLPSLTPSAETGSDSTIKNYVNANLYIRNNIDLTTVEPTYISFSGAGASDCFTSTTQKMHNSANDRVFQNSASATSLSVSMPTSTTAGWTTMQAYSIFPSSETGNLKSVISPGNVSYAGSLEGVGCGRHLFTAQNNGETEFKVVLTSSDPTYRVRLAMYEATNIIQSWQVETGLTANYAGTDSSCYVSTAQNVTVPIKMNVEKDKSYFIKCKVVDTSGNYINTNGKYCTCKVDGEIKTTVAN